MQQISPVGVQLSSYVNTFVGFMLDIFAHSEPRPAKCIEHISKAALVEEPRGCTARTLINMALQLHFTKDNRILGDAFYHYYNITENVLHCVRLKAGTFIDNF